MYSHSSFNVGRMLCLMLWLIHTQTNSFLQRYNTASIVTRLHLTAMRKKNLYITLFYKCMKNLNNTRVLDLLSRLMVVFDPCIWFTRRSVWGQRRVTSHLTVHLPSAFCIAVGDRSGNIYLSKGKRKFYIPIYILW